MSIKHQNNFGTNLTSNTGATDTTSPLNSIPTVDAPFYLAFDATNLNAHFEVKKCTSKTATNVNHSALTYDHTTAEEVRMVLPAEELNPTLTTDTFSATPAWDLSTSLHAMTMTANITSMTVTNETVGQSFVIALTQGGAGSYVATWFATIAWAGGVAPTLTTTVGKTDWFGFTCVAAGVYAGFIIGKNV
jgi:hypothetical protein